MILQIIISSGILDLVTGILAKISLGTGIWAKFRLGTGIWYPPSGPSFIIHCFEENNEKRIIGAITVYFQTLKMYNESRSHFYFAVCELDIAVRALDIALGNHALRAQPTDYSLICRYRLVNNL